jgi:hypothetical protein
MNRNGLIQHIELWKSKLGSYAQVAKKCNINGAALSTILAGKYGANESSMLQKIAKSLDYKESDWKIVTTLSDYKKIESLLKDAKNESMWFALSNKAGSGKTGPLEDLFNKDTTGTIVFIQAEVWSARQFLLKLVSKTIGDQVLEGSKYKSIANLTDLVVNYFNDMSLTSPVFMIDEFDKLKPAAKCALIPIFNRTEERLGAILSGTENFEKEMKAGVRLHKKGYDELDSRVGRTYIHLRGASKTEIYDICAANGISDEKKKELIWNELPKEMKPVKVKTAKGEEDRVLPFVEDKRLVKRLVKRELLMKRAAA